MSDLGSEELEEEGEADLGVRAPAEGGAPQGARRPADPGGQAGFAQQRSGGQFHGPPPAPCSGGPAGTKSPRATVGAASWKSVVKGETS